MKVFFLKTFFNSVIPFLKEKRKLYPGTRITRTESFNQIQETLEKYNGKAALILLFRFGEVSAETMLNNEMLKLKDYSFRNIIKKSIDLAKTFNWFKVESLSSTDNGFKLVTFSTFESALHKKVDYPVCSFITGFLDKVSNSSKEGYICKCSEVKCIAKGDDCCEFKIEKTKK